jgi:hypothetical protein
MDTRVPDVTEPDEFDLDLRVGELAAWWSGTGGLLVDAQTDGVCVPTGGRGAGTTCDTLNDTCGNTCAGRDTCPHTQCGATCPQTGCGPTCNTCPRTACGNTCPVTDCGQTCITCPRTECGNCFTHVGSCRNCPER